MNKKIKLTILGILTLVGLFTSINITSAGRTPIVTCNSATIYGTVWPNNTTVSAWFEWGNNISTVQNGGGTKIGFQQVNNTTELSANLSGLNQNTTYYYRLVVQSGSDYIPATTESFSTTTCQIVNPPVNGGWSDWSSKDNSCGVSGVQTRSCTNPTPANGGAYCSGPSTQTYTNPQCPIINTPVNGGWSDWSSKDNSCGISGVQTRSCNNPTPAYGGAYCSGPSYQSYTNPVCPNLILPPVVSLTATPTSVSYGGSSTLSWNSTNNPSCIANGGWSGQKAMRGNESTGALNFNTTYNITCTNSAGSDSKSVTVSVLQQPVIQNPSGTIYASSCFIQLNQSTCESKVSWNTYNLTPGALTAVTRSNPPVTVFTTTSGNNLSDYINYGNSIYFLYHNQQQLASAPVNASCVSGTTYIGGICIAPVVNYPVNGGWGPWSSKDNSCGASGIQIRSCNNPSPANGGLDCSGLSSQSYTNPACPITQTPVNGGWGAWSSKDNSCGISGVQTRSCNNPYPANGGLDCLGTSSRTYTNPQCPITQTPVNGGWGAWSTKDNSCGASGIQTRSCNNPSPSNGGLDCSGASTQTYVNPQCSYPVYTCQDYSATNYGGSLPCNYYQAPLVCQDPSATNYRGGLPCNYYNNYIQTCQDPSATNYRGTLPCNYYYQPILTCQDPSALNYRGTLPCTYNTYINNKPTVNISTDQSTVSFNGTTFVRWYTTNATSCYASDGSIGWAGAKSIGPGSFYTGSLTSGKTYTITCTNSFGSATDSTNVSVRSQTTTTITTRRAPTSLVLITSSVDRNQPIVPTIDNTRPKPGDEINYTVNYQNIGTGSITSLNLRVDLPYEVNYILSNPNNPTISGNTLIFNLGTLKANGQGTVTIRVRVRENIPAGTNLNFPATLSYVDPGGQPQSVMANVSAQVWSEPPITQLVNPNDKETVQLGALAFLFGNSFVPSTLIGWLLIILLITLVVLAVRKAYYGPNAIFVPQTLEKSKKING